MCFFSEDIPDKPGPDRLFIVESVDGVFIERHFWVLDQPDPSWWLNKCYLDYYGRTSGKSHKYESVDDAKKRLEETDNFKNIILKKYIIVE